MTLGAQGEELAAAFLKGQGYRIVARNYRCPSGEIDIVALDGDTIAFVEVKSRSSDEAADPEVAVHYHKRKQITRAAKYFISHKASHDQPCRFDVVAVVLPPGGEPQIEHFADAFGPTPR
jgi:putative endonuclease